MTTRLTRRPLIRTYGGHWLAYLGGIGADQRDLLKDAVTSARRAGCQVFELACNPVNGLSADNTAWALKQGKIRRASYCRFYPGDGVCGDPLGDGPARAKALATLSADLKFIGRLKDLGIEVPYITGPSMYGLGVQYPQPQAELLDKVVAYGEDVAAMLAGTGTTLCLEYLRPGEDKVLGSMKAACDVIDRISSASVGVHADIFHMLEQGEVPHQALELGAHRIKYLHAHGSQRQVPGAYKLDQNPAATDTVNWHLVAAALHYIRFDGWVVSEPFGQMIRDQVAALGEGLPPAIDAARYYQMARQHLMHAGII